MVKKKELEENVAELATEKKKLDNEKKTLERKVENLECSATALNARKKQLTEVNEEIRQANVELLSEHSRLTEENSSLSAENKSLADTKAELSDEAIILAAQRNNLAADTERLTAKKRAYEAQTDEARQEAETAIREHDEAKAERDAQRKEAVSNIANFFTGNKTKKLENELAQRDKTIEELKMYATATEEDLKRTIANLRMENDSQQRQSESIISGLNHQLETISTFFPGVPALLPAIQECRDVRLKDSSIKVLLDLKPHQFSRAQLYYPFKERDVDAAGTEAQIKHDPEDDKFHLHINGIRVFQWLKEQWQRLTQTIRHGIRR